MKEKIKVSLPIIVEGKYDKATLSGFVFCRLSRALDYNTTVISECQHLFSDFFELFSYYPVA